ncbi:MAG: polysaccharide deacetylase family protein [Gemmatimonadaceae bacterium]|nr:polysaccharide deacetylase family protein [Gemmatimonadaceae bacterium]
MDRRHLLLVLLAAACSSGDASSRRPAGTDSANGAVAEGRTPSMSGGAAAPTTGTGGTASANATTGGGAAANLQGRIPVLEYHVIGGDKNTLYTRTAASYRNDLEQAYKLGFRPITITQLLDKNFRDVPAGMSPVVVVFDDASDSQFRYLEQNGKLVVDPTSALGIWEDFAKSHPGWKPRAVFCMLNGGAAGHNFFGDSPKFNGQKREWRFPKVKYLADQGHELCDHTLWHMKLSQYPDAAVQEQIARNAMGIDSAVPGYRIRTMALPYGLWPKNRQLAWQGSWTDPKTKQTHSYKFDAVLEVSGGPTRSPYDPQFNPKSITRIEAIGDDIVKSLTRLQQSNTRMVVGK